MGRLQRPTQTGNFSTPCGLLITGSECNTIMKTGAMAVAAQWRRQAIVKGLGTVTSFAARGNAVFRVSWRRLELLLDSNRHPLNLPHFLCCCSPLSKHLISDTGTKRQSHQDIQPVQILYFHAPNNTCFHNYSFCRVECCVNPLSAIFESNFEESVMAWLPPQHQW